MGGAVSVLVPLGGECPHRARAWEWVRPRYRALGFEVVECRLDGAWSKAHALGDGAGEASGEILVVADADSWCDGIEAAIAKVRAGAPWAVPHRKVYRLDERTSAAVIDGEVLLSEVAGVPRWLVKPPYVGRAGGGLAVVRRDSMLEVPWDRRFVTWGGADVCWARALKTLVGQPWRGTAPFFHLWHPPERIGEPNQALCDRYKAAAGNVAAMRRLVDGG